jgi:hypothetical protein
MVVADSASRGRHQGATQVQGEHQQLQLERVGQHSRGFLRRSVSFGFSTGKPVINEALTSVH